MKLLFQILIILCLARPLYANNITSAISPTTTITNQSFFINGTFTINTNITFTNCQFYFMANAKINILNNASLTLNNCTLQAGCGAMWDGIYADDVSEQLIINNCTISDMENGVNVSNNAKLASTGSTYKNTAKYAINLSTITTLTQSPILSANTFTSNSNFIPYNGSTKGQGGINILNCGDMNIEGNNFNKLYNGVRINSDANFTLQTNTINLLNNHFSNLMDDDVNNWNGTVNTLAGKTYTTAIGAGVFIDYGATPTCIVHTNISNTSLDATNTSFNNCNKAIVSINNNLSVSNQHIANTTFGIMCNSLLLRDNNITNNKIQAPHIGIQVIGVESSFDISANMINECNNYAQQYGPVINKTPVGIDIKHFNTMGTNGAYMQRIADNYISIGAEAGFGISHLGSTAGQETRNNTIEFTTTSTNTYLPSSVKDLIGINMVNSSNVFLRDNSINGLTSTNPAVYTARQSKGIYFQDSKDCNISCNRIKYTKQGFYALGDNTTADGNITYNKMHHTQSPLYTYDGPSTNIGTFGNIGNTTTENANDWLYQGLGASYLQTGKKVIRNSNSILNPGVITTNNITFLDQTESDVIGTGLRYSVNNNIGIPM